MNGFNTSNLILISTKVCVKMKLTDFAFCWPCDPKVMVIVEVNGAYTYSKYEKKVKKFV